MDTDMSSNNVNQVKQSKFTYLSKDLPSIREIDPSGFFMLMWIGKFFVWTLVAYLALILFGDFFPYFSDMYLFSPDPWGDIGKMYEDRLGKFDHRATYYWMVGLTFLALVLSTTRYIVGGSVQGRIVAVEKIFVAGGLACLFSLAHQHGLGDGGRALVVTMVIIMICLILSGIASVIYRLAALVSLFIPVGLWVYVFEGDDFVLAHEFRGFVLEMTSLGLGRRATGEDVVPYLYMVRDGLITHNPLHHPLIYLPLAAAVTLHLVYHYRHRLQKIWAESNPFVFSGDDRKKKWTIDRLVQSGELVGWMTASFLWVATVVMMTVDLTGTSFWEVEDLGWAVMAEMGKSLSQGSAGGYFRALFFLVGFLVVLSGVRKYWSKNWNRRVDSVYDLALAAGLFAIAIVAPGEVRPVALLFWLMCILRRVDLYRSHFVWAVYAGLWLGAMTLGFFAANGFYGPGSKWGEYEFAGIFPYTSQYIRSYDIGLAQFMGDFSLWSSPALWCLIYLTIGWWAIWMGTGLWGKWGRSQGRKKIDEALAEVRGLVEKKRLEEALKVLDQQVFYWDENNVEGLALAGEIYLHMGRHRPAGWAYWRGYVELDKKPATDEIGEKMIWLARRWEETQLAWNSMEMGSREIALTVGGSKEPNYLDVKIKGDPLAASLRGETMMWTCLYSDPTMLTCLEVIPLDREGNISSPPPGTGMDWRQERDREEVEIFGPHPYLGTYLCGVVLWLASLWILSYGIQISWGLTLGSWTFIFGLFGMIYLIIRQGANYHLGRTRLVSTPDDLHIIREVGGKMTYDVRRRWDDWKEVMMIKNQKTGTQGGSSVIALKGGEKTLFLGWTLSEDQRRWLAQWLYTSVYRWNNQKGKPGDGVGEPEQEVVVDHPSEIAQFLGIDLVERTTRPHVRIFPSQGGADNDGRHLSYLIFTTFFHVGALYLLYYWFGVLIEVPRLANSWGLATVALLVLPVAIAPLLFVLWHYDRIFLKVAATVDIKIGDQVVVERSYPFPFFVRREIWPKGQLRHIEDKRGPFGRAVVLAGGRKEVEVGHTLTQKEREWLVEYLNKHLHLRK